LRICSTKVLRGEVATLSHPGSSPFKELRVVIKVTKTQVAISADIAACFIGCMAMINDPGIGVLEAHWADARRRNWMLLLEGLP